MNRKTFAILSSLFLLIGGASAWQFTATVDTNFDDFYTDSWGLEEDDTIGSTIACNALTSYAIPECSQPINIEVGGSTKDEVSWSIADAAAIATDNRKQVLGSVNKRLDASYGVATAEAKAEAIANLNGGLSEAKAKSNTSDVIRDWYSEIQRNVINYRNRHVLKFNESRQEALDAGLGKVWYLPRGDYGTKGSKNYPSSDLRIRTYNYTLFNGEKVESYHIEANLDGYDCGSSVSITKWTNITDRRSIHADYLRPNCDNTYSWDTDMQYSGPDGRILFIDPIKYLDSVDAVNSKKDQALSNSRTIVGDIYDSYAVGEVNVSESLGPLETLKVASTSYESTGYYDYATLTAEQMGLNTNDTYAFTVEWNNTGESLTYQDTGQLFIADDSYNGTIEVGKEYDASGKQVWLTRTDSAGDIVQEDLNGTFTVTDMFNKETGNSVSETAVQEIEVYDSNVTELQNQLEDLRESIEEYKNEEASGTAGGTSSATGLFGLSPATTGASAVAGILALILTGVILA